VGSLSVRRLGLEDVAVVASIDRSEQVEVEYCVVAGELQERPVTMVDVPPWDVDGDGPHSVAYHIGVCTELVGKGAVLLGAFEADAVIGVAIVDPSFEPPMAWLAFLHVTAPARRRGAATALWATAVGLARAADAQTLYVSATPTGSAVGFYLRQGCRLADPAHPALWAKEPDDIHLVCPLPRGGGSVRAQSELPRFR
jgi:GNAT superfamily N-acetyltransferase